MVFFEERNESGKIVKLSNAQVIGFSCVKAIENLKSCYCKNSNCSEESDVSSLDG
jgi:hypothetical protein